MTAPPILAFRAPCFGCSHRIHLPQPMRFAIAFRPSLVPAIAKLPGEHRCRCRSCGLVNVFVPASQEIPPVEPPWRAVETKRAD